MVAQRILLNESGGLSIQKQGVRLVPSDMLSPSSKSLTDRSKAVQDSLTDRPKAVQDSLTDRPKAVQDSLTDRPKAVQDGLTDRSKAVLLLWIVFRVILSCLFLAALWAPAGKGLTSWSSCV